MLEQKTTTSKPVLILIAALVVAVGVQTWYIAGMHKKLNEMQVSSPARTWKVNPGSPPTLQPLGKGQQPKPRTPDDDWFNRPFSSDNWNPLQEMQQMQDHMNQMFGDSFGRFGRSSHFSSLFGSSSFSPRIDLKEEDDKFVIHANIPGAKNNNIDVKLEDQTLTIKGTIDQEQQDTDDQDKIIRRERRSGKFSRTLTLPSPVAPEGMKTHLDNGVLEITIPKK
jgi:HSP20 family protein